MPLRKTLFETDDAQETSGMGWTFLWILSFVQAKENISAVGPRTDLQTTRRDSDTKPTD